MKLIASVIEFQEKTCIRVGVFNKDRKKNSRLTSDSFQTVLQIKAKRKFPIIALFSFFYTATLHFLAVMTDVKASNQC